MQKLGWLGLIGLACGRTGLEGYPVEQGGPRSGVVAAAGAIGAAAGGHAGAGGTDAAMGGLGGAAAGAGGKACGPLIDDMESGTGHICEGDGRRGVWYAFNDGTGTQWPTETPPGTPISLSEPSMRPGDRFAIHTYGQGFLQWGAGVGADFDFDGESYQSYDAVQYDGIRFWAKSDQANAIIVRLSTPTSTEIGFGGACDTEPCPQPQSVTVELGPQWSSFQLAFNDFEPHGKWVYRPVLERRQLLNIQFMVRTSVPFDFWIDDLTFYTADHDCCASLPEGCRGVLTFEDPGLADAVRYVTGATGDIRCNDICTHPLLDGLSRDIHSLAGLECMTPLEGVTFSHNPITDMSPLANLPNLLAVDLDYTQIAVLPSLRGMTKLEALSLDYAPLTDLAPALDAPVLEALAVSGAKLDCAAQAANLAKLRARSIVFSDCP